MTASTVTSTVPVEVSTISTPLGDDLIPGLLTEGVVLNTVVDDLEVPDASNRGTQNPPSWLTGHRRIPDFRAPRVHPEWSELTHGPRETILIGLLFRGCRLMQVKFKRHCFSEAGTTSLC
jgi:hypothetical protein